MLLAGLVALAIAHFSCLPIQMGVCAIPPSDPRYQNVLQIRFLGVGGFLLRRGDDVIMTAPLYSNPSTDQLTEEIRPSAETIHRFHPSTPDVKAILVGHAHYDHLMDVPYVWDQSRQAVIFGNASMKNILSGYVVNAGDERVPEIPEDRIVALNEPGANRVDYRMCVQREGAASLADRRLGKDKVAGCWVKVPGARIRIRALCSEHPAQVLSLIHFWPGSVYRPRFTPPRSAEDYQEGETLAYLIDFMDETETKPLFRVYYQDAPTNPTLGEVPSELIAKKSIDVAILCVGNFLDVTEPTHILRNTKPRAVILGHWENFFEPQKNEPHEIPFAKVGKVVREVQREVGKGVRVILPNPQAVFHFDPAGDGNVHRGPAGKFRVIEKCIG